jgi:hypothetical protein
MDLSRRTNKLATLAIFDPATVFRDLTTSDPVRLEAVPREHGIYALHDHAGAIRYVGITKNDKLGFYGRINNRHVTGSESRSHKFSHAYNTGRMWRAKKDDSPDANAAKRLRSAFVRRYCRVTFVAVSPTLFGDLSKLEIAVQAIAPARLLDWGSRRDFVSLTEPKELVDTLLDELRYSPDERAAVGRQAALYAAT